MTITKQRTKFCNGCKTTHPLNQFGQHKGHGDGYESRCKVWMRLEQNKRRAAQRPIDFPPPKLYSELGDEQKAMTEQTPDGFKAFFEKYSGLELHNHAYNWAKVSLENDLLLLNVPPGHAKTTIMAQWFPIWQLACDRNNQIMVLSRTLDGAKKTAYKIAYELENNRDLNMDFGRFRNSSGGKWSVGEGALLIEGKDLAEGSGDLSIQIRGQQSQILGMRATLVIADDVADRKIARSPIESANQLEWFLGDVMSRLQPNGKAVCIGQRVHGLDLYGMLAAQKDEVGSPVWNQVKTPAVLDWETEKVLWPERWPLTELRKVLARQGTTLFETMYQQNPEAAGDFIKKEWIKGCLDRERKLGEGWLQQNGKGTYFPITRVISIDPSPTQYCGIVVADVVYTPGQQVFTCNIVDIRRGKYGLREMVENIEELTFKHRPSVCIFEENSVKWLHEDPAWNRLTPLFRKTIGHNTGRNKQDPVIGVWSLGADFEAGRIRLPYADEEAREASELLIREALAYTSDGKGSETDDVLMATWFMKPNYKNCMPLDSLGTRFRRGLERSGWKGWGA